MSQTTRSLTPCSRMIFAHARPGRARADHHHADVLGALADDPQRVQQRGQHDDRGAVLVVVEDRDVERLLQPPLDLEAARRGDVLEVDAAERRRDAARRCSTISSTSVVSRHSGKASTPASSLNSIALPSITGIAASGPMSPRPSTAVPSETTATVWPLIVSVQADSGSSCDRAARRARRPACRPSRGRRGS